ncbi:MAG: hypothetical protein M0Z82_09910 [Actinomycetota bacterium]|nr:hypothetical protein [Actinomycetota bacterium]
MVRAHGLRGAVVIDMLSNRPERTGCGARLVVAPAGWEGGGGEGLRDAGTEVTVDRARPLPGAGRSPWARWLVELDEVTQRAQAERLCGRSLWAAAIDDPEVLWVHQLVGATVLDLAGSTLGTVTAVLANPASDLLELDSGALVPLRFVVEHAAGRVVVDVPSGLVD